MGDSPIRLNIGGGASDFGPEWTNIDRCNGWEAYPIRRTHERDPFFADNSVDEVYASHVIEHFGFADAEKALREWVRVLKPGCTLKVATVDMDKVIDAVAAGNPDGWPIQSYLYGGQTDANDFHRSGYNESWLRHLMTCAGLHDIRKWAPAESVDCSSLPVSLNLMGTKGGDAALLAKPFPARKIQAVISLPRYGPTKYFNALMNTVIPLGIPFEMQWGAWWDHRLTNAMENAIASGAEWILTLDYDSPSRVEDVKALAVLMDEHPEVDALAPMQVKREEDICLFRPVDADGKYKEGTATLADFDGDVTEVGWAHFGLTLIRVSALQKMKKPWFLGVPDANGGWSDHSTHPDIYFWKNLRESGGKLFIANHVAIPHMQDIAVWPRHDLRGVVFQYMGHYQANGKPAEARR